MSAARQEFGEVGERVAERWLRHRGWRVLQRRFRNGHRDIDLVAERDGTVAFDVIRFATPSLNLDCNEGGSVIKTRAELDSEVFGDEYTTLPDLMNRPLHMWLDLDWSYMDPDAALNDGQVTARVRALVRDTFEAFESGSIQQLIHRIGVRMLEEIPALAEVNLEADNRTWDTIAERGSELGVYTDARPPYGCLGLSLKR